jgi:hypothetical protein
MRGSELPGLDDLPQDPAPVKRGPGRPRKIAAAPAPKTAGNRGKISTRSAAGKIVSKAAMIAKVREDARTYADLIVSGWEFRDPECASVMNDQVFADGTIRVHAMADRLVDILSRNDNMLRGAYNSGFLGELVLGANLVLPVIKTVWRAHGPGGTGHQQVEGGQGDYARFPAYAPAAA